MPTRSPWAYGCPLTNINALWKSWTWRAVGTLPSIVGTASAPCLCVPPSRDWLMALLMVSVTVGTIFGIAGLRSDYLIMKAQETGFPASSATYVTFVTMQLLFFVTGIFFSYSMHPADAALERILKQTRELRRRADALLHERATLAARHDRALGLAETALNELRADCLAGIAEYRDFNMASRGTPTPHWLRESLDHSIFRPVDFGSQIDPSPMSFDELIAKIDQAQ